LDGGIKIRDTQAVDRGIDRILARDARHCDVAVLEGGDEGARGPTASAASDIERLHPSLSVAKSPSSRKIKELALSLNLVKSSPRTLPYMV
jgi:hypothetical protein